MLTILSQSTTDGNRDRAFEALRERFPPEDGGAHLVSWEGVRRAPEDLVADVIRVAGLVGQKTSAIRGALERLASEHGRPTLAHLAGLGDAEAIEYLTSFRGVGVKTAACVLCFSLRRPVLPVDTHVHRIAKRLGWAPETADATRTHDLLAARVAPEDRFALHMALITHGREICRARGPLCDGCPLEPICPRVGVS
ncbi:MAG: endonuclease III [Gemmatimonadetes bacterium]|nr:endonuclease III [Gemmatimonadota bacterium]